MRSLVALSALALIASPALAQEKTGYTAIATGDLGKAEQILNAERRIYPNRPELMLNLAAVYGRTGRASDAQALYTKVLDRPAVAMLMPSGVAVSSHDVAELGLRQLSSTTVAAR